MQTISTFDFYMLAFTLSLFSYILGMVIRGMDSGIRENHLLKTIAENHQCYLTEAANLRKDLINEMAVRKTAEQLNARLRAEINALQAHFTPVYAGGQSCLEEHIGAAARVNQNEDRAVA